MKNLLITSAFLICISAKAQFVTLEKQYSTTVSYTEVVGVGYYVSVASTGDINMYKAINHALVKSFTAPAVSGYSFVGAYYITDKFFDDDDAIEYLAAYKSPDNTKYVMNILSETGTVLQTLDNAKSSYLQGSTQYGARLMVTCENAGTVYTNVYKFTNNNTPVDPGTDPPVTTSLSNTRIANVNPPYPNPTTTSIKLFYTLKEGQTGELLVTDILGNVAANYHIGSDFESIVVNVGDLAAGTYNYHVKTSEGIQSGKTFIVQ